MALWTICVLVVALITSGWAQESDICQWESCTCQNSPDSPDLVDVVCRCLDQKQSLHIGVRKLSKHQDVLPLPSNVNSLEVSGCHHVELTGRSFNGLQHLRRVTITDIHKVVLHPRMYEARLGNGPETMTLQSFLIRAVHDLKVETHSFEGISIKDSFLLDHVNMQKVASFAFSFDQVANFSIINSRFDRISMWGIKLIDCGHLQISSRSRFFNLASQAVHALCDFVDIRNSIVANSQDESLSLTFGSASVEDNTFERMAGRPFIEIRPMTDQVMQQRQPHRRISLIFRGNKFSAEPALPFNCLAFPAYDDLKARQMDVQVSDNHFVCDCHRLSWFLAAVKHKYKAADIQKQGGSVAFLEQIYQTAGHCLQCGLKECHQLDTRFSDFASHTLLEILQDEVKCSTQRTQTNTDPQHEDSGTGHSPDTDHNQQELISSTAATKSAPVILLIYTCVLPIMLSLKSIS